jgi:hypothetical protein
MAVAVAYVWAFARLRSGLPAFPPHQATERGFFAVVSASGLALVPALSGIRVGARLWFQVVAAGVAVVFVAGGIASTAIGPWALAGVVCGAIACFVLLDLASFCPTPLFAGATAAATGALAQVLLLFGSALLAQLAGTVAILMALVAAASLFFRRHVPAAAAIPLAAIVVTLSVDAALFLYDPPPTVALVLLAVAPAASLVVYVVGPGRLGPLKTVAVALAATLAVTGLGFYLAWRAAPPSYG